MSCAARAGTLQGLLLAHAARPQDPLWQALAGVLADAFERHGSQRLPLPGLGPQATRELLEQGLPGAAAVLGLDWAAMAEREEPRFDEIEDLTLLLLEHADPQAGPRLHARGAAWALACASLGNDHLWQDLRLPSRRELSALIAHWFPALAARNTQDMKWKKFFYKQLCEREQLFICKAPSCAVCDDHPVCFGPE
ncbi:MAG: nitrogen fixation protein NifQ [Aquabacterium sp.]|jgi:nitrogen fixation protein NifQ|nr:MAG: nitrogen fixation protein NifQ [Aquabacterium sp.]